jgi:glycosyltransferase involved in cell wall biosynthesis
MSNDTSAGMAVLFLNPSGQLGGAERSLLDIMASLREARPEWRLGLLVTAEGPLVSRAESIGVETRVLPLQSAFAQLGDGGSGSIGKVSRILSLIQALPGAVSYTLQLGRAIKQFRPRVLHSNGFKMHVLAGWAKPQAIPLVWHVHDFVSRRPVMSVLLRRHKSFCSAVIANSARVAQDVEKVCEGAVPVHLVYNAIDLSAFNPAGAVLDLDAASHLPPPDGEVVRVGLVATMGWWKGHRTFLKAVAMLDNDLPIRAYVIGGPLYETEGSQHSVEKLRAWAAELNILPKVGFTGFIEDVPAAMRALDVVVHASTEPEPFGLVIIEGMACERPVIASDGGGAAELIRDGENALGHRPGDAQDLARCIDLLVRDGGLRRRLGVAGRLSVETGFDRARLASAVAPIYQHVASSQS